MTKLIACTALVCFSRYVLGNGIIHGDPDNNDAKKLNIPEHKVAEFAAEGLIKPPKGFLEEIQAAAATVAAKVKAAELAARETVAAAAAADAAGADPDAPPADA